MAAAAAATIAVNNMTAIPPPMNPLYWLVNHPGILNFAWTQGQTLGSSPKFLTLTTVSYLSLTLFFYQVPILSLEPTLRRRMSALHNLLLVVSSLTMAAGCSLSALSQLPKLHHLVCFPRNIKPTGPVFFWAYVFYLSKIYEYVDTLLILVNNPNKRLSFLHVYHHMTVVIMCYLAVQYTQSTLPLVIVCNCMVHVFMYSYYFLCALGFRPKWKRLVTDCQILQFASSFVIFSLTFGYHFGSASGCAGIRASCFSAGFVATLLYLFLDFHSKSYSMKRGGDHIKKA